MTAWRRENPYLSGVFGPVAEETTNYDLPVTGTLPEELEGRFLLIGPNPVAPPSPRRYHWFLGDGMVHGVMLRGGRALWYRNRWIRQSAVTRALGEPRAAGPRSGRFDTVNTSVIELDGITTALVEGGCLPVSLTDELETIAYTDLGGTLPCGFTAHPRLDPATGELHGMAYYHGRPYVQYIVIGKDARARKAEAIHLPAGTPLMHEMSLTERFAVMYDLPLRFSFRAAVLGRMPYRWKKWYPARMGVLPREGTADDIRWFEIDSCFVFHTFTAYEIGESVVVQGARYESVFADPAQYPLLGALPTAWEWVLDLATGQVRERQLDDRRIEMPKTDERLTTRQARYGYALTLDENHVAGQANGLIRYDFITGQTLARAFDAGCSPNEATFVPRSTDAEENDGWLMSYVYDARRGASDLYVLDAQDMAGPPVAVVSLPVRVPVGFHGAWLPAHRDPR